MNIILEQITDGDPFVSSPELCQIWSSDLSDEAKYSTSKHLNGEDDTHFYHIYLIKLDNEVVGITGFYISDIEVNSAGLFWHGVIPSFRNRGISSIALFKLCLIIKSLYPNIANLIELAPCHDTWQVRYKIHRYFTSIGFESKNDMKYAWPNRLNILEYWTPYYVNIDKLLDTLKLKINNLHHLQISL